MITFYRLPRQHHKHLKSTNMLERLNEKVRCRTYVVRLRAALLLPNSAACHHPLPNLTHTIAVGPTRLRRLAAPATLRRAFGHRAYFAPPGRFGAWPAGDRSKQWA